MEDILLFWVLWACTIGACGYNIVRALRWRWQLFGFQFVASLMWMYFYVYMAFNAGMHLGEFLPSRSLVLGQSIALISYLGLWLGWHLGGRRTRAAAKWRPDRVYSAKRLWTVGLLFLWVGLIGQYTFFSSGRNADKSTSQYWYMSFWVCYPAVAMCLAAMTKDRLLRSTERYGALIAGIAILLAPFVLNARRGPLFPMILVLAFVPSLVARRLPSRVTTITALVGAGLAMMLLVAVRHLAFVGDQTFQYTPSAQRLNDLQRGVSELSMSDIVVARTERIEDNEYAFHCAAVTAMVETGRFQYGTGYLSLLTHWIPRQWWEGKPYQQQGFFPSVYEVASEVVGWTMSSGASSGGAANAFEQFWFFCPAFWALIAYLAARLYRQALISEDLAAQVYYIGFLCATHWLISQGFGEAFVPGCIFVAVPALGFRYARQRCVARPRSLRAAVRSHA